MRLLRFIGPFGSADTAARMLGPLRRAVRAQSGLLRLPVRSLAVPSIERQKHTASGAVHAHADTFLTYETFNEQVKQVSEPLSLHAAPLTIRS